MSRAPLRYDQRTAPAKRFEGFDPDQPFEGHFRMRLVSGGVPVGIRIWYGPPHDPVTGEELDRSWRWQATANDKPIDLERVWPRCAGDPIGEVEHAYLVAQQRWGERHAPDSPQADPTRKVDLLSAPIPL